MRIFTAGKQPWVVLSPGISAFAEYYGRMPVWPADRLVRFEKLTPRMEAHRASVPGAA